MQNINSALRKRIIAEREAKEKELNTAKARRVLNLLAMHIAIFDVILAVVYFTII